MEVIMIGSQPYDSYASLAYADQYLAASISGAADWSAAEESTREQALVTSTRVLDRQRWRPAYDTQAEREGVQDIIDASVEMALALVQGSSLQTAQNTAQALQSIKAGSVALSYFRGAEGRALRFPLPVWELLRDYLAGGDATFGAVASGTDGVTVTGANLGFTEGL